MKKVLNSKIFIVIITMVICISGTLYATNVYKSEEVIYTPKNSDWSVENVKSALDDLYSMKTELDTIKGIGDATAGDIASGKTAVVKGEKVTGTKEEKASYKVYEFKNVKATAGGAHAAYKDAGWVPITYDKNYDCSDGVCSHDHDAEIIADIGLKPSKIISANICLTVKSTTKTPLYNIRLTRGYSAASSSASMNYWYLDKLCTSERDMGKSCSNYYSCEKTYGKDFIDSTGTDNSGSYHFNNYNLSGGKLYFLSHSRLNTNSSGNEVSGTANSPYQVYGTEFYLSGTIIYEE